MENNEYSSSEWYSQPENSYEPEQIKRRKFPKWVWIVVCIVAVIAVVSIIFAKNYTQKISDSNQNTIDDWKSYYSTYYASDSITETEFDMDRTEYDGEYTMSLDETEGNEISLQEIYKKCEPTTVYVTAKTGGTTPSTAMGTGIIVSTDGLIVTNAHIIDSAETVTIKLTDDSEYDAKLVGGDSQSDIALLKIEAENLTPAVFADSANIEVGDSVVAIGNPLKTNLSGTMTNGIVSAINRGITYNGHSMTLIQTNTAINEGSSGGPLIDMCGRVIGITNMKMNSNYTNVEGIGFAIPSSTIQEVVNQFIEYGKIVGKPSLGITVGPISQAEADYFDIPVGLYISNVIEGSDSDIQGLEPGDIIVKADGNEVTKNSDVNDIKNSKNIGDTMTLTIWRDGEYMDFTITLNEMSDYYN